MSQTPGRNLGDPLLGSPLGMAPARASSPPPSESASPPPSDPPPLDGGGAGGGGSDLDQIQADSQRQPLPDQEKLFRVAGRVRSKLNNLPDPTKPPLGYVNGRGYDVVFPFCKLPHLAPTSTATAARTASPYHASIIDGLRTMCATIGIDYDL